MLSLTRKIETGPFYQGLIGFQTENQTSNNRTNEIISKVDYSMICYYKLDGIQLQKKLADHISVKRNTIIKITFFYRKQKNWFTVEEEKKKWTSGSQTRNYYKGDYMNS